MAVTLLPTYIDSVLTAVFADAQGPQQTSIGYAMICGGVKPVLPTDTAGVTVFKYITLSSEQWLPPSDGVVALSSPISFTPTSSGTITFLRLANSTSPTNQGIIDIPLGLVGSGSSGVISSLTATSGTPVLVTDLRIKINTVGNLSVGSVVANAILKHLTEAAAGYFHYKTTNAASRFDGVSAGYTRAVTLDVYDGSIPASADTPATGTKLWTKSLTINNLFDVSGLGMSLAGNQTGNALASGTPTYLRVTKAAYSGLNNATGLADSWPATVFQLPIGPPTNGCIMTPGVLVSGQSATITNMTVTLQP